MISESAERRFFWVFVKVGCRAPFREEPKPKEAQRSPVSAGDRQAADLGKYRQQWEKLEGREPVRQQEQTKAQKIERDNSPGMSL